MYATVARTAAIAKQDCGRFFAALAITGRTEVDVERVVVWEEFKVAGESAEVLDGERVDVWMGGGIVEVWEVVGKRVRVSKAVHVSIKVVWGHAEVDVEVLDDGANACEVLILAICVSSIRVSMVVVPPFIVANVATGDDRTFRHLTVPFCLSKMFHGSSDPFVILAWKQDCTCWPAHFLSKLVET